MSYKIADVIWNDDGSMATIQPTPLEALKQFRNSQYQGVNVYADELLDIIETALKRLKVLDIIKEKTSTACNCLMILKCRRDNLSYENYKKLFLTDLTKEEYDILKEVLL